MIIEKTFIMWMNIKISKSENPDFVLLWIQSWKMYVNKFLFEDFVLLLSCDIKNHLT